MPRKAPAARSTSKGRNAPKTPKTSKTPKTPKKSLMDYSEGDKVLAKWPGTSLYFQAKITYVRDDDDEYDVQYEDGTIYTIKSRDVRKKEYLKAKTPRSQSRGRSPGRRKSPGRQKTAQKSPSTSATRRARPVVKPKSMPATTPTRQSARIAERQVELSGDEEEREKARAVLKARSPSIKDKISDWWSDLSFEWVGALLMSVLAPFILISLHTLCTAKSCKPMLPFDKIPKKLDAYWDPKAFGLVVGFMLFSRILHLLPLGAKVKSPSGQTIRLNGFISLILIMACVPVLVFKKVNLNFVTDKYFYLFTSSLIYSFAAAIAYRFMALFFPERRSNINPKGDTGNLIVDLCHGREMNPRFFGSDVKLELFRFSMTSLVMLNLIMVINNVMSKGGEPNPVVIMSSAFQILYAMDALFFEEYFFFSHDSMNFGTGLHLISTYMTFPFIPTLVTRYVIANAPQMPWYFLVCIAIVNAVGYIMFRASETQRCEFAKDPSSLKNLETLSSTGGKKLLVSGWWGFVRHPNYLGELLVQWSWVLPAAQKAGRTDLLIYYLPIMTTLVLIMRCHQQNVKNKKKYGAAWTRYCERVKANLIPKVY